MIDQLCPKCETLLPKAKNQSLQSSIHSKISLGFAYHLALDLQFSFQAISLLIDFAQKRSATALHIQLVKITNNEDPELPDQHYDQNYVQLAFSGNAFSILEAQQLASSFHSAVKEGMDLVLGIFGIGKTGIVVSNNDHATSVVMFSVDDRVNPNYYKEEAAMIYVESNSNGKMENINGKIMKKIILQGLKIYHPQPQKILECKPHHTKILIFHPKIFVSSNKLMFYQLRESNYSHDIDTHNNTEKLEFLNKLGYEISIHAQFRLSCYLNCLYLQSHFPIILGDSERPISKSTYLEYLETLRNNGVVTRIGDVKLNGVTKAELYETTEKYFMQNNGILLYWNGRMINRFDVEFGRMLEQKFFKKKYRSPPRNIWTVVGIIELDSTKFTPNMLRNKFMNSFQFRRFNKDLQMFLENISRKCNAIVIENQDEQEDKDGKNNESSEYMINSEPRKRVKRAKEDNPSN